MHSRKFTSRTKRRGAAAVEFAVIAPIFVTLVLGVSEISHMFELQNQLALAARDGARLAGMDRRDFLPDGQTINAKIEDDVRNFLTSNGVPGDEVDVFIVSPEDHTTPFDLDDDANDMELFELRVELPYSVLTGVDDSTGTDWTLSACVVFRNGRAVIAE